MTKILRIEKCDDCLHCDVDYDGEFCDHPKVDPMGIKDKYTMHKDCPLEDAPDRNILELIRSEIKVTPCMAGDSVYRISMDGAKRIFKLIEDTAGTRA